MLIVFSILAFGCGDRDSLNLLTTFGTELTDPSHVTELTPEVWQKLEWNRQRSLDNYAKQAELNPTEHNLQLYQEAIIRAEELKIAQEEYYNRYIDADGITIIGNAIIPDEVYIAAKDTILIMTSKHPSLRERFRGNHYMILTPHQSVPELSLRKSEAAGKCLAVGKIVHGVSHSVKLCLTMVLPEKLVMDSAV